MKQRQKDSHSSEDLRQCKSNTEMTYEESQSEAVSSCMRNTSSDVGASQTENAQAGDKIDMKDKKQKAKLKADTGIKTAKVYRQNLSLKKRGKQKGIIPVKPQRSTLQQNMMTRLAANTLNVLENQCINNANIKSKKDDYQHNKGLKADLLNSDSEEDEAFSQSHGLNQNIDKPLDTSNTGSAITRQAIERKKRTYMKNILCEMCGRRFSQKAHFNQHECVQGDKKPYLCQFDEKCDKTFSNSTNRKKHIDAVHLNLRKYNCQQCEKKFKTSSALKVHMSSIHSVRNSPHHIAKYTCKLCGKFLSPSSFKIHLQRHSGEKNFTCSYGCGRQFYDKSSMRKHEMVHSGVKPYKCSTCGDHFTRKQYLDSHMWKHTGSKRFQCELCPRYFSQKGNRDTHMRNHSGEKHFTCSDCGKKFNIKSNLNAHLLRHKKHHMKPDLKKTVKVMDCTTYIVSHR